MITDIPTEEELRSSAIELLVMAWKTAISSLHKLERARDVGLDDDETRSELRAAYLPSLRHAAVWIHQAQELGLKARIAGVSPYLLLAGDHAVGHGPTKDARCCSQTFERLTHRT